MRAPHADAPSAAARQFPLAAGRRCRGGTARHTAGMTCWVTTAEDRSFTRVLTGHLENGENSITGLTPEPDRLVSRRSGTGPG